MPGPETTFSSIGQRWANVSNTPYRYWKAETYEGGIHTPMIAFWPKGIKAPKGSISSQLGHVKDFMATFVELASATYPKQYKGHEITPMQGKSLAAAFKGNVSKVNEPLFQEHFGARYVRYNGWKLVALAKDRIWHLYEISKDETEINDLTAQYPDKVKELDKMWQDWANSNKVFPKPK